MRGLIPGDLVNGQQHDASQLKTSRLVDLSFPCSCTSQLEVISASQL